MSTPEWINVNINTQVQVLLNEEGAQILNQNAKDVMRAAPQITALKTNWQAGEVYQTQLWGLMREFGEFMSLGKNPPFDVMISLKPRC